MSERMPVVFIGHGNPMNALADNKYTRAWREIGESVPKPRAVLCVSAHWYLPGVAVTASETAEHLRPAKVQRFVEILDAERQRDSQIEEAKVV